MFSMKLRQMEKLNYGQSFGRDSNDLNVLAWLETVVQESLPRQWEGVLSWGPGRESEVRAVKMEQNVYGQAEREGRQGAKERRGSKARTGGRAETTIYPWASEACRNAVCFKVLWLFFFSFMAVMAAPICFRAQARIPRFGEPQIYFAQGDLVKFCSITLSVYY